MKQGTDGKISSHTDTSREIDELLSTDRPTRDSIVGEMDGAIAMLMKKHGGKDALLDATPDRGRLFKVSGSAMAGIDIRDGDTVLVDDQLEAKSGDLVLVTRDGLIFEVRRLLAIGASTYLHAEDSGIPDEDILRSSSMRICGVVTGLGKNE